MSYSAIDLAAVLYSQGWFLMNIQWSGFFNQGFSLAEVLLYQARPLLLHFIPLLTIAVVLSVAVFLLRNREIYADEVAASTGHRPGICCALEHTNPRGAPKSMFHPSLGIRLKRVADPHGWGKLNYFVLGCIVFIAVRAADSLSGALTPFAHSNMPQRGQLFEALSNTSGDSAFWLREVGNLGLTTIGLLLVAHYVYRAGMSRLALGQGRASVIAPSAWAAAACIVGTLIGTVASNRFLNMISSDRHAALAHKVMWLKLEEAFLVGLAAAFFCAAASGLAVIAARTPAHRPGRTLAWMISLVVVAFLMQVLVNFFFVALAWLGGIRDLSLPAIEDGFPTEVILAVPLLLLALIALLGYGATWLRSKQRGMAKTIVNPSRIINIAHGERLADDCA